MVDLKRLFNLEGQVALITGSGQNIGRGFAYALGHHGAKVAVIDQFEEKANSTVAFLRSEGIESTAIIADVTIPHEVTTMIDKVYSLWHRIDIACNNVGLCYGGPAEGVSLADWDKILQTNLRATFNCCQEEFKVMKQQGFGKIINTASVAGVLIPHPQKITAYNTAKAGVIQLSRSLAAEWAEYGIKVNSLSPGVIDNPIFENSSESKEWATAWRSQIPFKRLANIEDLYGAIIFLASHASDYMTGQNLLIDGGHTLW